MSWARRHRVPEMVLAAAISGVALLMNRVLPVFRRVVPEVRGVMRDASGTEVEFTARDPSLDYPLVHEQLSMPMVILLTIGVPATLVTIASVLMRLPKHFKRDVAVAWLQGHAINNTLTHTIKCMAGRLRPNFYALVAAGREGPARKSFPSGHSSTSAAAMTMLALLALAILRSHAGARRHRTLAFAARYACVALPALFALYVGVTRTQDYFHDYADVLAGLMIGTLAGFSGHKLEGLDEKLMHQYPSSHEDARAVDRSFSSILRSSGGGTWTARDSSGSSTRDSREGGADAKAHGATSPSVGGARPGTLDIPSTPQREVRHSGEGFDTFDTWPTPKAMAVLNSGQDAFGGLSSDLSRPNSFIHLRSSRGSQASIMSHGI